MPYFSIDETQLYYKEIGEGVPFLMIHGWAIDHRYLENCMEPVFEKCGRKIKRIYIDLPGMGLSKPGRVKNGDGVVQVIGAFLQQKYPSQKVFLCGNSYGSVVSRGVFANYPDLVSGLILIAPALDRREEIECDGPFAIDEDFMATLDGRIKSIFVEMHANLTRPTYERFLSQVYPSYQINENNDFLRKVMRGRFSFDINKRIEKNRVKVPTLLLAGKYDTAAGYKKQQGWVELFGNCTYILAEESGHNISVDQPDFFVEKISEWLVENLQEA